MFRRQEAEKQGISPEEVYAALCMCGGSNPCDWLTSELPHLLDEICAMAASVQLNCGAANAGMAADVDRDGGEPEQNPAGGGGVKLSRAEAKLAWLAATGDTEKAVRQLLRDRQVKVGKTTGQLQPEIIGSFTCLLYREHVDQQGLKQP